MCDLFWFIWRHFKHRLHSHGIVVQTAHRRLATSGVSFWTPEVHLRLLDVDQWSRNAVGVEHAYVERWRLIENIFILDVHVFAGAVGVHYLGLMLLNHAHVWDYRYFSCLDQAIGYTLTCNSLVKEIGLKFWGRSYR